MFSKIVDVVKKVYAIDQVERAVKTFVQGFVATIIVGWAAVDSFEAGYALAVAAVAAGASAVWNSRKALFARK